MNNGVLEYYNIGNLSWVKLSCPTEWRNGAGPPVPFGTFGRVAATFRLRYLKEIFINSLGVNKRRLKPEATKGFRYKSSNLDIKSIS